jgi:hypothetical protein
VRNVDRLRVVRPEMPDDSRLLTDGNWTFEADAERMPRRTDRVMVPPPPTEIDRTLRDEQQVARLETLMIKGFSSVGQLCEMLGVEDRRQMERFIRRVYARWDILGSKNDLARQRGLGLTKLEHVQRELWVLFQNSDDKDIRAKIVIMTSLTTTMAMEQKLIGLTEKVVDTLNQKSADSEVAMRLRKQDALAIAARRLGQLLLARRAGAGEVMDPLEPDSFDMRAEGA